MYIIFLSIKRYIKPYGSIRKTIISDYMIILGRYLKSMEMHTLNVMMATIMDNVLLRGMLGRIIPLKRDSGISSWKSECIETITVYCFLFRL